MGTPVEDILKRLGGPLSQAQAEAIWARGKEAVVLALMQLSAQALGLGTSAATGANAPPSSVPPYAKPPRRRRGKKPGAKRGHPGRRRVTRAEPTRHVKHPPLKRCPDCGGPVHKPARYRTRRIEDIPEVFPELTEHTIPRQWCPKCRREVEPVVDEAMPKAALGHGLVTLSAWLHYGLGVTISQVISVLSHHVHLELSQGGLVNAWQRLGEVLTPWYDQIGEEIKSSGVLHADETGWRVNGATWWLWCFANGQTCYYLIDRCRGSPALERFFVEAFDGVLVSDFWAAYHAVWAADRQCCLVHLLRELETVDQHNDSAEWKAFAKKLRRLIRDGIRLRKREDFEPERYGSRIERIDQRLMALAGGPYADADAARLGKRLRKYCDSLFTFLDRPEVPFENNFAERMIRPAVVLRKNSQSNRSEKGAAVQAVLMSIYRTLQLRGHDPLQVIPEALRAYLSTGTLPALPEPIVADG